MRPRPPDLPFPAATPKVAPAPGSDAALLEKIYRAALVENPSFAQLRELTTSFPGRLSGSASLEHAIAWTRTVLEKSGADRTELQPVMVPHWTRGAHESVRLLRPGLPALSLTAHALGGSAATAAGGLRAPVVAVHSLDEVAHTDVRSKIVLFNRSMSAVHFNPIRAYEEACDQRNLGPATAARHGAVGALTRSLTHATDDVAHAGTTFFPPEIAPIPAAAVSAHAADQLAAAVVTATSTEGDATRGVMVEMSIEATWHADALSHNVIGEIIGRESPEKIIAVAGHLDCWDITPGAHDDGAGCIHAIDTLRIVRACGYQPRHTLRAVLFTNEENGVRGGQDYADRARLRGEDHLLAIESDHGAFQPRGFNLGSPTGDAHVRAARWRALFDPYGIHFFESGYGGVDVQPLLVAGWPVAGLMPDSQRYFDLHHTPADTIATVNRRELELGSAAMAALACLVDRHGL